jgi:hypothetical protein
LIISIQNNKMDSCCLFTTILASIIGSICTCNCIYGSYSRCKFKNSQKESINIIIDDLLNCESFDGNLETQYKNMLKIAEKKHIYPYCCYFNTYDMEHDENVAYFYDTLLDRLSALENGIDKIIMVVKHYWYISKISHYDKILINNKIVFFLKNKNFYNQMGKPTYENILNMYIYSKIISKGDLINILDIILDDLTDEKYHKILWFQIDNKIFTEDDIIECNKIKEIDTKIYDQMVLHTTERYKKAYL